MIVFEDIKLRYQYDDFDVLKGANFTLIDGVNTVLADVQSGKSSICKLLVKDVAASSGQIFVDGKDVSSITNDNLDILYLPTKPAFFESRSVLYNIEYPLKVRKRPKMERQELAKHVAQQLGVDFLDVKLKKLNDSDRRRVALARGLTVRRKIVLFDDFFTDETYDIESIDKVLQLFEGATCVILTSDARKATGNTVVLDGGLTVYQGDADGARQIVNDLGWLTDSMRN